MYSRIYLLKLRSNNLHTLQSSLAYFTSQYYSSYYQTREPVQPDRPTYIFLLKSCTALPSLLYALSVHAHILKSAYQNDIILSTSLISTYSDFSDTSSARKLFDEMSERDVAAWNSMLSGYSRNEHLDESLSLFRMMGSFGTKPNSVTLSVLLGVAGGLGDRRIGRSIHGYVYRNFELGDASFDHSLIVYYNKFGDLRMAEKIFELMPMRYIVTWNSMMSRYAKNGCCWRALEWLWHLRDEGLSPDLVTFDIVFQACGRIGKDATPLGESLHGLLVRMGFHMNVYEENSLLIMYCKCGRMESAKYLFDSMEVRNLVSWSIILNGYVQMKHYSKEAINIFKHAFSNKSKVSSELLVGVLQATRIMEGCIQLIMSIHCLSIKMGFGSDVFVSSSLITSYGCSRKVELARRCLDGAVADGINPLVCWNSVLSLYVQHGYLSDAAELLHCMKFQKCSYDAITLVNILSLCSHWMDLGSGKAVHGYMTRNNFDSDVFVTSSLLEFYIKCRLLRVACCLFSNIELRNTVTWNTMIHGCNKNGFFKESLRLFYLMQEKDGLEPDATSMAGAIEAIAQGGYDRARNYIHDYALQNGSLDNEYVANSIISMHSKFCDFDKASVVFDTASKLTSVTWNTMIAEYCSHGLVDKAMSVFYLMKLKYVAPDSITLLSLLKGVSDLGSLICIKWIHTVIFKYGFISDVFLATSLIDLYSKCGELNLARQIFDEMNSKTIVSWNSMIQGYGIHGNLEDANILFSQLRQSGLEPTVVTFLILMSACSHAGDLGKGQQYFYMMAKDYSLSPTKEHLASYIDLLGRSGFVKEAYKYLVKMPIDPGVCAWGSLLGACRVQGNLDIGLATAHKLFDSDPFHSGYYALLSNILSESEKWIDASLIKQKLGEMRLRKAPGWSVAESTL